MSLNADKLASDMLDLFKSMLQEGGRKSEDSEDNEDSKDKDVEYFADKLAKIMINHIKSATVTVKEGIALQAGSYTGATTAAGTGSLS